MTSGAFLHWCIESILIDWIDSNLRCLNLYVINVQMSINMTSAVSDVVLKYHSFTVEASSGETCRSICKMFKISPMKGKLSATDRPTPILVTFKATKEMVLKEHPMLFCHVIEPNVNPDGETVARIPIPLSVNVAYTRSGELELFDFTCDLAIVLYII